MPLSTRAYSPQGLFLSLSLEELQALKTSAISRIASGETIQLSGAGKSKGKQWSMSASDVLAEVNFALRRLMGDQLPNKTHFNVAGNSVGKGFPIA